MSENESKLVSLIKNSEQAPVQNQPAKEQVVFHRGFPILQEDSIPIKPLKRGRSW